MKIIFVVVPFAENDNWDYGVFGKGAKKITTIGPPLGTCYVAASARETGADIEIIDCMARNLDALQLKKILSIKKFDILGISTVSSGYADALQTAKIAKEINPNSLIILGGVHAIAMNKLGKAKSLLQSNSFDIVVLGEGEEIIKEIIDAKKKQQNFSKIKGIIWKNKNNIQENKLREPIKDLNKLAFPAVDLLRGGHYTRSPSSKKREPVFSIITTRGCPYDCIFCDKIFGRLVRRRSIQNVLTELKFVKEQMGAKEIRFWDETFTLNKQYVIDLCKVMIQEKLNLPWSCNGHVNTIDDETLDWMKKAGCWEIDFGIEAGTDEVLKKIKKNITTSQILRDVKMVKKHGIEVRTFFILGLPGDTKESILETINFAIKIDSDYSTFYLPQVHLGSELFKITLDENQITPQDIFTAVTNKRVFYYPNPTVPYEELVKLAKLAHKRFYKRAAYIIGRIKRIHSFEDIKRYISAGVIVLRF